MKHKLNLLVLCSLLGLSGCYITVPSKDSSKENSTTSDGTTLTSDDLSDSSTSSSDNSETSYEDLPTSLPDPTTSEQTSPSESETDEDSSSEESSESISEKNEESSSESISEKTEESSSVSSSEEESSSSSEEIESSEESLSSSEISAEESSSINIEREYEISSTLDSVLYFGDLTQQYQLPTYFFKTLGDVPYISLKYGLAFINMEGSWFSNGYNINFVSDRSTYARPTYLNIDADNDTILVSNYEYFGELGSYNSKYGMLTVGAYDGWAIKLDTNQTNVVANETVLFNLGNYNIDLVAYEDELYIPTQIYSDLFFNGLYGAPIAFNGDNYFIAYENYMYSNNVLTDYGNAYYGGSYSILTEKTTSMADFYYNELCFKFDNWYGLKSWKNISDFNTYLIDKGFANSLKSTNISTSTLKFVEFIRRNIDDGHSAYINIGNVGGYDSTLASNAGNVGYGDRVSLIYNTLSVCKMNREKARYTGDSFNVYDDTLIIRFDGFVNPSTNINLHSLVNNDENMQAYGGTFGLFYRAFKSIEGNDDIKRVLIDITCNGGGGAHTLVELLGFLTKNPQLNVLDTTDGSYHNNYYKVDTNLDKKYDDNDSFEDKYDFYLLTSGGSFSCGNGFPTFLKTSNAATIVGDTSGGGSCVVKYNVLSDGTLFQMSGNMQLISSYNDGKAVSNEDGITPDIQIDSSIWYNYSKLLTYLK